jgi:hypothetical protein
MRDALVRLNLGYQTTTWRKKAPNFRVKEARQQHLDSLLPEWNAKRSLASWLGTLRCLPAEEGGALGSRNGGVRSHQGAGTTTDSRERLKGRAPQPQMDHAPTCGMCGRGRGYCGLRSETAGDAHGLNATTRRSRVRRQHGYPVR